MSTITRDFHPLAVTNLAFWARSADDREAVFKQLRDEAPVSWQPPMQGGIMPSDEQGMWVVTRHEHITEVSMHPELFCSGQGVQFEDLPEDLLEASQSFLAMDDPRHRQLRRLVSSAFTPKQVARIDDQTASQARRVVDGLIEAREGDFVDLVSRRLPMWTVYEMLGLDPALREEAAHMADEMVSFNDDDVAAGREPGEVINDSLVRLLTIGLEFADQRRRNPADDLMTNLVQAEIEGQRLTDDEIAAFFVLLSVAGNDTTRNTISLSTHALQQHPDQKAWLLEDFDGRIPTATEEFIRWASPVMTFRRTATQDTELGGQKISKGEWVAMIYSSGNRDERIFDAPHRFDLSRPKNPHVGFGGGGPHFCMGNFVAKMQMRHLFGELLTRVPGLRVGEPEPLIGNFVRAVKRMPCTTG
ncbi:cytochrome P450 [Nocardia sp. NPDC005366]|uniref:cytochrome P450 n=1 Tax=Nocardia sp. NPDC005366 TaxID=3156878 RepID=UPI0033B20222